MLANFHTHTTFSDGKNTPEEVVISALEQGLCTIGFSDHAYTPYDLRYCMKDEDGYDGFMIVNVTDPGKNLSESVTVTFKKASKAIVYVEGEEQTVELENGTYTFDLSSGEGVFVIPIV